MLPPFLTAVLWQSLTPYSNHVAVAVAVPVLGSVTAACAGAECV